MIETEKYLPNTPQPIRGPFDFLKVLDLWMGLAITTYSANLPLVG